MPPTNEERARLAQAALEASGLLPGGEYGPDEVEEAVTDLVADLMHFADGNGVDARQVLNRGWDHAITEIWSRRNIPEPPPWADAGPKITLSPVQVRVLDVAADTLSRYDPDMAKQVREIAEAGTVNPATLAGLGD
jgi:hypothetical protein